MHLAGCLIFDYGLHAQPLYRPPINIRTVGGVEACWAARKQMAFGSMTDARLTPVNPPMERH